MDTEKTGQLYLKNSLYHPDKNYRIAFFTSDDNNITNSFCFISRQQLLQKIIITLKRKISSPITCFTDSLKEAAFLSKFFPHWKFLTLKGKEYFPEKETFLFYWKKILDFFLKTSDSLIIKKISRNFFVFLIYKNLSSGTLFILDGKTPFLYQQHLKKDELYKTILTLFPNRKIINLIIQKNLYTTFNFKEKTLFSLPAYIFHQKSKIIFYQQNWFELSSYRDNFKLEILQQT